MDRLQRHRHEELTAGASRRGGGGGGAMAASRRGRFYHHDGHGGGGGEEGCRPAASAASVPVVDQAECTAQTCRSCVAVTLADVIALGCCPCAVVSLLGLAFVKAPLAVARRCLRRLRRRHGELRHKKRVRDMDPAAKANKCRAAGGHVHGALEALEVLDAAAAAAAAAKGARGSEAAARAARVSNSSSGRLDAEKVWMEMYRVGQWGFGRLSVSMTPPRPTRPCGAAAARGGGRKDTDLRCES
ncbi:unnamed protein product [Urochloa decumbens]|uniref:Uncharacterized protein n=1 Tax=Urochloa decumbens TaxID=240449 RepID=A0ABC8Z9C9_9POAL